MTSETWVFRVTAQPDESLGHFLGRFRRANELSHKAIAAHLGVNVAWVKDWEIPSRRRNPTELQIIALSKLVEVPPHHLRQMQPPDQLHLQTRLCPACYAETPVHRVTWQQLGVDECDLHQLPLLKACPVCRTGFRTPALWNNEPCLGCGQRFEQMESNQVDRAIEPS
jgi:transcriptional regulator with XRE-family HTH domain